jgi:hypothetical protein
MTVAANEYAAPSGIGDAWGNPHGYTLHQLGGGLTIISKMLIPLHLPLLVLASSMLIFAQSFISFAFYNLSCLTIDN